ncbi:hypothetical protein SAMN04487995_0175 [Dyadobacter koreensis]|uniref:Uncharacterized protein n=1 Tax=Dyadobacter koreensis TaxID=408657 RepID=A0A1H6QFI5_9BACT|nr:hypothetical protein [Dyadobacter koreensis]SEI37742.1 hypothetical protein SAMN04487995_0175 [Dyadobacter koreensis]
MADNPMPDNLMNSVLAKLYDIIANGDGVTVPKSEDIFFTWCSPGIPFDENEFDFLRQGLTGVIKPESLITKDAAGNETRRELTDVERAELLASNTTQMYMQAESFARFVDFVPDASGINDALTRMNIKNDEGTLSDIYEFVLRFSQVANTELTPDEKAKIEKYRQLLQVEREKEDILTGEKIKVMEESPLVKAYAEKRAAWEEASLIYNNSRINALTASTPRDVHDFAINANIYRSRVNFALNDWINNGFKNEFEGIAARIDQMSSRDLTIIKALYKDAMAKAKLTGIASGGDFYYTSLAPAGFVKSRGWTRFTFTNNDYSYYSNKTTTTASGMGGLSLGLFNIGGSGGGTKTKVNTQADMSNFELSFEIAQVSIQRSNWFKLNFLTSNTWRFDPANPESKGDFLSDGKRPPSIESLMPAFATSMIFIRGLNLKFRNSLSVGQTLESAANAGGALSFGPFFMGGNAKKTTSEAKRQFHSDSQGISVDGLQCIGFKCHLMPLSPNPNLSITNWV